MKPARARILARLRARQRKGPEEAAPDRRPPGPGDVATFCRRLEAAGATVERIPDDTVPQAVARYLKQHNLAAGIKVSPALAELRWETAPLLETAFGVTGLNDRVAVVQGMLGVAETGSILHASGSGHPTTNHFLTDHAIAVVAEETVCADLESALANAAGATIPRTLCLITGPSRTGDIEQRIELGAHGPQSLHVLVTRRGDGETPESGP